MQFIVRDTGTGIPEEELPRLFERFHRVEGAKGRSFEGSGIGLALVQELVKLHGGSVTVESKLGEGSTFTVAFPRAKRILPPIVSARAATPVRACAPTVMWRKRSAGFRTPVDALRFCGMMTALPLVVLADDNADMRDYATRSCELEYRVAVANDGQEALAIVQAQKPDLVLTDVMMPVLDGFGLLNAIRSDAILRRRRSSCSRRGREKKHASKACRPAPTTTW